MEWALQTAITRELDAKCAAERHRFQADVEEFRLSLALGGVSLPAPPATQSYINAVVDEALDLDPREGASVKRRHL